MLAVSQSEWIASSPAPTASFGDSRGLPVTVLGTNPPVVVTHIQVFDAPLFVSLDGSPCSPYSYDYVLPPNSSNDLGYQFVTPPELIQCMSNGGLARVRFAFETNLIGQYLYSVSQHKSLQSAPTASTPLPTNAITGQSGVFATLLTIGAGELYVTLDGRPVSTADYDLHLFPTATGSRREAIQLSVDPAQIKILGIAATYKVMYERYVPGPNQDWFTDPIYNVRGFR